MDTFILRFFTRMDRLALRENQLGRWPGRAEDICVSEEVQVTDEAGTAGDVGEQMVQEPHQM